MCATFDVSYGAHFPFGWEIHVRQVRLNLLLLMCGMCFRQLSTELVWLMFLLLASPLLASSFSRVDATGLRHLNASFSCFYFIFFIKCAFQHSKKYIAAAEIAWLLWRYIWMRADCTSAKSPGSIVLAWHWGSINRRWKLGVHCIVGKLSLVLRNEFYLIVNRTQHNKTFLCNINIFS